MTPATLRKLEWAGSRDYCWETAPCCPVCEAFEMDAKHAPDCELDAAIREAERRETGERPAVRVGDVVLWESGWTVAVVSEFDVRHWNSNRAPTITAIYRDPLWRQEAPTHD